MSAVLEVTNVAKRFGGVRAVDGVSFAVEAGETLAIIGPNGSGKSTLFDLIGGTTSPDSGRVLLDGKDLTALPADERAERGIARTFQSGRTFDNATLLDNVLTARRAHLTAARPWAALRRVPLAAALPLCAETALAVVRPPAVEREALAAAARAERQLARFGPSLAARRNERAYALSYADRRRTEIARALALEPRVLLLDEPAAGMNEEETAALAGHLRALRAAGIAIVIIEHKLDLIAALAERVIVLDGGVSIFEGTPAAARRDRAVIAAYVGQGAAVRAPRPAVAPSRPLLELRDVRVRYGPILALDGVSLHVDEGEIVSLLGANAAGKSTLMRTVLGLVRPERGRVVIDGRDRTAASTAARIRSGLASVPEGRRVFPAMSVEDNLLLGAYLRRGREVREDLAQIDELFPRLRERRKQRAGTLSGGEQQMLATARALMSRPRLLCLDEPTMGLAPLFVERVFELLAARNRAGTTIFMVEQNATAALAIADRGYLLRNGRIVADGSAQALLADPSLNVAYLGG